MTREEEEAVQDLLDAGEDLSKILDEYQSGDEEGSQDAKYAKRLLRLWEEAATGVREILGEDER